MKGATRWLKIAGVQFQVAEVVKIGVIVALSYLLQRNRRNLDNVRLLMMMWGIGGISAIMLYMISNDLSSSIVILGITVCITFVFTDFLLIHLAAVVLGGALVGGYVYKIWKHLPSPEKLETLSFRVGRIAARNNKPEGLSK